MYSVNTIYNSAAFKDEKVFKCAYGDLSSAINHYAFKIDLLERKASKGEKIDFLDFDVSTAFVEIVNDDETLSIITINW